MERIFAYIVIPFQWIAQTTVKLCSFSVSFFLSLSLWNRVILLLSFAGIISVLFPVAQFEIFAMQYGINNPLGIQLIVVVILFDISVLFRGRGVFIARVILAGYYLVHFSFFCISGTITHAEPYTLAAGFYLNMATIILYIVVSAMDYLYGQQ